MILKEIQGSKMYLYEDDLGLSKDLIENGIREPEATKYLKSILNPNWIVLEAGANIGYYTFIEAQIVKKVYAIEPVKKHFETLNKSIEANNYKNIKTFNIAVGAKDDIKEMLASKYSNVSTLALDLMNKNHKNWFLKNSISKEKVRVTSIDNFCLSLEIIPDLIRMDIEGYEVEAILGMQNTIKKMAKGSYLFIEFHPMFLEDINLMLNAVELLKNSGFSAVNLEKDLKEIIKENKIAPEAILKKW